MTQPSLPHRTGIWHRRWPGLTLLIVLLVAACSAGSKTASHSSTPTVPSRATVAPTTAASTPVSNSKGPNITPIPGNYSVYMDPTYGYSFEYPSSWVVYPAIGVAPDTTGTNGNVQESDVDIADPSSPDEQHPLIQLIVRATNNDAAQFVQNLMCGAKPTTTAAGYPAIVLDTGGGDPVNGFTSPAFGRAFFAKGLAFEIWLQSSAKLHDDIVYFFAHQQANYNHILATFNPGPGAKTVNPC
jgi:hypothetical protein